jgi:ferrous-iron efflux pump FieF
MLAIGHKDKSVSKEKKDELLIRSATYASVSVALLLIILKSIAWISSDSLSLLSSLFDSSIDLVASIINMLAVRFALQPPDEEHRFGHGKAEDLAVLAQSAFISGSALFLVVETIHRFWKPEKVENSSSAIAVMIISIVVTLLLVLWQNYIARKTRSNVIKADSVHYAGDLLTNLGVIIALLLTTKLGWQWADSMFALIIAAYLLYNVWEMATNSLGNLLDKELPDEIRERIKQIAISCDGVKGLHALKTRAMGRNIAIQMHIEIDGDMKLRQAHDIAHKVEFALRGEFPDAEIILHQDPDKIDDYHTDLDVEEI